jgi:hypothetical protein
MASILLHLVAVLHLFFLNFNSVSSLTLPGFELQQWSRVSPNAVAYNLDKKEVGIEETEGTNSMMDAESSGPASTMNTLSNDKTMTTSNQLAPPTFLLNPITLGEPTDTTIIYPLPPATLLDTVILGIPTRIPAAVLNSTASASESFYTSTDGPKSSSTTTLPDPQFSLSFSSTIYTPPSQPFEITSSQTQTRRYPTNPITTFATPTFVISQTVILTDTITTLFVIDPTRTSTILGYELFATISTITSTGYDCSTTNSAPATASKVVLNGISRLPLFRRLSSMLNTYLGLSGFETGCDTTVRKE